MTIFSSNFFILPWLMFISTSLLWLLLHKDKSTKLYIYFNWKYLAINQVYVLAYIQFLLYMHLSIFISIRSCVSLDWWPDNSRADLRLMLHIHCFNSIPALDFRRHIPHELRSVILYGPIQFHSSFPPFLVVFLLLYLHTQSPTSKMGGKCYAPNSFFLLCLRFCYIYLGLVMDTLCPLHHWVYVILKIFSAHVFWITKHKQVKQCSAQ